MTEARSPDQWDSGPFGELWRFARSCNTTGLLVRSGGRTVLDAYAPPNVGLMGCQQLDDGRTREDVASAQKSVTAVLAMMAVERGLLDLDDPASSYLGEGWTRSDRAEEARITVRHLMAMTSGLDDDLVAVAAPGELWQYNLGPAYHSVKRIVAVAAGTDFASIGRRWLFEPIGMDESAWEDRPIPPDLPEELRLRASYPDGTPFEALVSTTRDLAKLGEALMGDGVPGLPADLLAVLWRPSSDLNPAYGLLWWLNGEAWHLAPRVSDPVDGWLVPEAPAGMVGALGAFGRFLHIVPSEGLVVARLGGDPGDTPLGPTRFGRRLWELLRQALDAGGY